MLTKDSPFNPPPTPNIRMEEIPGRLHANAQHQYSHRVPSPPRIFVPPPITETLGTQHTAASRRLRPYRGVPDTAFLTAFPLCGDSIAYPEVEWRYNSRNQAQRILPYLWLGPLVVARDQKFLRDNDITMVVGIRKVVEGYMMNPKTPRDLGLALEYIDIDSEGQLMRKFDQLVSIINRHMDVQYGRFQSAGNNSGESSTPGRILLFCESGNDRSAVAVAAYIMATFDADIIKAIQSIQKRRFSVNIDDAARNKLFTYQKMLEAQRSVQAAREEVANLAGHLNATNFAANRKRNMRMMEDDDMDIDMDDDDRFRRDVSAPFEDELQDE